ncbi:MAG: hypothetical protein ACPLPR_09105, partial [Bacillota bacterium]
IQGGENRLKKERGSAMKIYDVRDKPAAIDYVSDRGRRVLSIVQDLASMGPFKRQGTVEGIHHPSHLQKTWHATK